MEEKFLNHRFIIVFGPSLEELKKEYFDGGGLNFAIFENVQDHEEQTLTLCVDFMTAVNLENGENPLFDGKIHELRGPADKNNEFDFVARYNLETRTGWIEFYQPEKGSLNVSN